MTKTTKTTKAKKTTKTAKAKSKAKTAGKAAGKAKPKPKTAAKKPLRRLNPYEAKLMEKFKSSQLVKGVRRSPEEVGEVHHVRTLLLAKNYNAVERLIAVNNLDGGEKAVVPNSSKGGEDKGQSKSKSTAKPVVVRDEPAGGSKKHSYPLRTKPSELTPSLIFNIGRVMGFLVKNENQVLEEVKLAGDELREILVFLHSVCTDVRTVK